MESLTPIAGMTMVSIGAVMLVASLGGLLYYNWPRSKSGCKASSARSETSEQGGEIQS